MENVLMKCGHVAQGKTSTEEYCCVICMCKEIASNKPSLEGRKAYCGYCKRECDSDWSLPFFEYRQSGRDQYYCGCGGWD